MTKVCQQLFDHPNPVALVTGAGAPRVGKAIAETLSKRGYRLAIHSHSSFEAGNRFSEDLSQRIDSRSYRADLFHEDQARDLVNQVCSDFGRLDVVVNSAAIWNPIEMEKVTADDLDRYFKVNTVSSFIVAQQAGAQMVNQEKGGVIINIGDWATVRPYCDYAAYFLSKGSIPTMTRMLAVELATRNSRIRVNAVLPGPVMIPESMDEVKRREIIDATLLKREGTPQNVADACVCLIENDFITGVTLPVDGGRSIYSASNPV